MLYIKLFIEREKNIGQSAPECPFNRLSTWTADCVSGHDELLNFRNEEDEDEEDDEDDDEVDDENDDDVGLEYLQKPVDELEVHSRRIIAGLPD